MNIFEVKVITGLDGLKQPIVKGDSFGSANQALEFILETLDSCTIHELSLEDYDCLHGDIENSHYENNGVVYATKVNGNVQIINHEEV